MLPDGYFRHGEYPVFVGNVLQSVVVLLKGMSPLDITARGEVPALVDPRVPPICLIVDSLMFSSLAIRCMRF